MIDHFDTLWNGVVKGFGVHDPGKERHTGQIPMWDAIHPGRDHEKSMQAVGAGIRPIDDIEAQIAAFAARRNGREATALLTQDHVDHLLRDALSDDDET